MNPLMLVQFWPYLLIAALALGVGGYVKGCTDEKGRFDEYKVSVRAVGEAQEARTRERTALDAQRKKESDNAIAKLRTDYAVVAGRLRDERTHSSLVPPAPADAARPDRAAFDRAELDRALQEFRAEVAGIVEEGDQARIDLDTAKRWAKP